MIKKDSSRYFLPFNVTEARKTLKNGYAFVYPDLCVFELKGLEPNQINAIEYKKDDYPIKRKIETGYSFNQVRCVPSPGFTDTITLPCSRTTKRA